MMPTSCASRSLYKRLKLTLVTPLTRSPHSYSPHTRSDHFHALQELKDDLLDDAAWPVVLQWFTGLMKSISVLQTDLHLKTRY